MAYLKQIEGVTAPVRVDNKPSYGSYVKTSATDNREVYKDGEWYEETGGELVTNGTNLVDTSGWTADTGNLLTVEFGGINVDRNGGSSLGAIQDVTTEAGVEYSLQYTLDRFLESGTSVVYINNTSFFITSLGSYTHTFVADSATTTIKMGVTSNANGQVLYSNISVFKSSPTLSTLPLPPQSYIEDSNGKLVEFEVIDGQVVDTHTAGYVPAIVENKVVAKEVSADSYAWANDGIDYVDEDAIGSNPVAKLYPDGTIVGSTSNGSYTKYPNGEMVCNGYQLVIAASTSFFRINLPFLFPNTPSLYVSGVDQRTSGGNGGLYFDTYQDICVGYRSATDIRVLFNTSAVGNTIGVYYTAIGRWK